MLPSLYATAADLFSMIHLYTIRNFRKSQVFLPFQRVKKEIFSQNGLNVSFSFKISIVKSKLVCWKI